MSVSRRVFSGGNPYPFTRVQPSDFAMFKNIPFNERVRMQFRAESFNVFNRANFNNPNETATGGLTSELLLCSMKTQENR